MIPLDHIGSAMAGYLPLLLVTLLLELLVVAALARWCHAAIETAHCG